MEMWAVRRLWGFMNSKEHPTKVPVIILQSHPFDPIQAISDSCVFRRQGRDLAWDFLGIQKMKGPSKGDSPEKFEFVGCELSERWALIGNLLCRPAADTPALRILPICEEMRRARRINYFDLRLMQRWNERCCKSRLFGFSVQPTVNGDLLLTEWQAVTDVNDPAK